MYIIFRLHIAIMYAVDERYLRFYYMNMYTYNAIQIVCNHKLFIHANNIQIIYNQNFFIHTNSIQYIQSIHVGIIFNNINEGSS